MGALDAVRTAVREAPVTAEEDEFDPFAGQPVDPPPDGEGDDRVHGSEGDA